jgi:hypothetical protein
MTNFRGRLDSNEPCALEHETNARRAQLAAENEAAEEGYRDMLAHPESVIDAPDLFA